MGNASRLTPLECGIEINTLVSDYWWLVCTQLTQLKATVPVIQYCCSAVSPQPHQLSQCPLLYYVCMVGNWKAWKLHTFDDKQQVKWFEEIRVLVQTLVARGMYQCVIANYCGGSCLLWCYVTLKHQELFTTHHGTTPQKTWIFITSTVRTQNLTDCGYL